jgi:hypothetical protein
VDIEENVGSFLYSITGWVKPDVILSMCLSSFLVKGLTMSDLYMSSIKVKEL